MSQHRTAHIFFILLGLYYPAQLLASTTPQCFENVISCAENSSSLECTSSLNISSSTALSVLRTSSGSVIAPELSSIQGATALSYGGCLKYCGPGSQEPFSWNDFSQEWTTWLLPYLALLFQLPFGARRRTDDLMSAIVTLGSPTLAGYSLYLTLLNARWVNDYVFADIHYPSAAVRRSVVRVLSNLQQVPLRVHPGEGARLESLVIHPDNDDWWNIFAEELEYSQTWSIASVTSILWVMIAYLLSVVYAISNLTGSYRNGEGTASGLLWLLPVVVGWLILSPKCDYKRVLDAYNRANQRAFVANSDGTTTHVTTNFGLTISPRPPWEHRSNIISPDEGRIPPIFNYARVWLWAQNVYAASLLYRVASEQSNCRVGVDGEQIPGNVCSDVPRENRLGDQDQIHRYCHPAGDRRCYKASVWPRGIIYNMIIASLMGLQLQWGTTGAAFLGSWFTPTIGMGCRSLMYLLYGLLSTTVWILLVSSSVLGYYAYLLNSPSASDVESTRLSSPPRPRMSTAVSPANLELSDESAHPLHEIRPPNGDTARLPPPLLRPPSSTTLNLADAELSTNEPAYPLHEIRAPNGDTTRLSPPLLRPPSSITLNLADAELSTNEPAYPLHEIRAPNGDTTRLSPPLLRPPSSITLNLADAELSTNEPAYPLHEIRAPNGDTTRLSLPLLHPPSSTTLNLTDAELSTNEPAYLYEIRAPTASGNPNLDGAVTIAPTKLEHNHPTWTYARTLERLSNWLRWIGKTIAILNAIGTIANALSEYAGVYGNCFCDASVFTWGPDAFMVLAPSSNDYDLLQRAWYIGLALALSSCGVFVGSIFLVRDSLLS